MVSPYRGSFDRELVKSHAKERGLDIYVYTIKDQDTYDRVAKLGVDGVFVGNGNRDIEVGTKRLSFRSQSGNPEAA